MARAKRIERILGEHKQSKQMKTNGSLRRKSRYAAKKASKKA